MKKKLVLALATLMCISLCACGGNETTSGDNKDGFTPNKTTETTEQKDTQTQQEEKIPSDMTVEEMQKYYDTEQYVGTPRYTKLKFTGCDSGYHQISEPDPTNENNPPIAYYSLERIEGLNIWANYYAIVCDNNTPDDYNDDVIAYLFKTPIEE